MIKVLIQTILAVLLIQTSMAVSWSHHSLNILRRGREKLETFHNALAHHNLMTTQRANFHFERNIKV